MDHKILRILIVDDDEGDRKQLWRLLSQSNLECECTEATSIEAAKTLCEKSTFDCIIIDYLLPGQDGLTGIAYFHVKFPELVIIMATGEGDEMVASEAIKRGASDYIVKKNLSVPLLAKTISTALEKVRLEKKIKEQENKIEYIAFHDHLTDTPNRLLFEHTLSRALADAKRNQKIFAVMLLDLDRFKNINDTLGHEAGDTLLKQVAKRFQSVMRASDMLARLGGDEFGILISEINRMEEAGFTAKKIISSLQETFLLGTEKINITPSIGIATYPSSGETVADLIQCADKAMYQAKNAGKNNFQFYTTEFNQKMTERFHIETALRNALEKREFYCCYQPIYHLADNALFGMEVLLRWNHPEFGKIPIDEVIAVAEESGLIIPIGDWIITEAFSQYKNWKIAKESAIKLAINISPRQLNVLDWLSKLKSATEQYQINPHSLIFELTETDLIKNMRNTQEVLSLTVKMGAQIFIDDFGMGYSSLNMIKNLPISGIKIDKSCIQGLVESEANRQLTKSLIVLAENMGFMVVAEGIETKEQLDFLKSYANNKGQGYYLSKPISADEMAKLLLTC